MKDYGTAEIRDRGAGGQVHREESSPYQLAGAGEQLDDHGIARVAQ